MDSLQGWLLIDVYSPTPIARMVTMLLGTASTQVDVVAATPLPGVTSPVEKSQPGFKRPRKGTLTQVALWSFPIL